MTRLSAALGLLLAAAAAPAHAQRTVASLNMGWKFVEEGGSAPSGKRARLTVPLSLQAETLRQAHVPLTSLTRARATPQRKTARTSTRRSRRTSTGTNAWASSRPWA